MKRISLTILTALFSVFQGWAEPEIIKSPNGSNVIEISCSDVAITYSLGVDGKALIEPSTIALLEGATYKFLGSARHQENSAWNPVWGAYSEIQDEYNQLTVNLEVSGHVMDLICRVYDDGVGFRFVVPAESSLGGKQLNFALECNFTDDFDAYFPKGESGVRGPISSAELLSKDQKLSQPLVASSSNGSWFALLESDLYAAKSFAQVADVWTNHQDVSVSLKGQGVADGRAFSTPWRVILLGETPGDLVNSTVALSLATPSQVEDTSWLKPGKGLWDWRVHGYDNGEFEYGINTQSYLRFIDFAAEHGIEYFTIDDHWYTGGEGGKLVTNPTVDIEKVMAYAKTKGVGIILYFDRRADKGELIEDSELFAYYKSLGAVGIKYGFRGRDVPFTRESMEGTAAQELFIFHHDGPTAMVGVERTLPNLITREYCHAQQDCRRAFTPTTFLKMAMVNALTGPLDMANGNFGIQSINSGVRAKGPKKHNSYMSTVVSEVARCVVISSGLVTLPDAPEEYLKKLDLFEFLKQMPTTWDYSRVINSKMAEYITTARRAGDDWFVGSVNNEEPRDLEIVLDFLNPDTAYEVELFEDAASAHGLENPEVYKISKKKVKLNDVITASMAAGGGHAMILRPID